jgi:hypothetical protein
MTSSTSFLQVRQRNSCLIRVIILLRISFLYNYCVTEAREVLQHMLQYDPRRRLTFDEMRSSDWMMGVVGRLADTGIDTTAAAPTPPALTTATVASAIAVNNELTPDVMLPPAVNQLSPPTVLTDSSDELTSDDPMAMTCSLRHATSPVNLPLTGHAHSLHTTNIRQQVGLAHVDDVIRSN